MAWSMCTIHENINRKALHSKREKDVYNLFFASWMLKKTRILEIY